MPVIGEGGGDEVAHLREGESAAIFGVNSLDVGESEVRCGVREANVDLGVFTVREHNTSEGVKVFGDEE